jgi:hypothetical protein
MLLFPMRQPVLAGVPAYGTVNQTGSFVVVFSCRHCNWQIMTFQLPTLICHVFVVTLYFVVNAVSLTQGGVMDIRRQKAHDLADRARITFADGCYTVPSQSGNGSYTVILDDADEACDCPDFELRAKPCKHIMAVRLYVSREQRGVEQDDTKERPSPKVKRPTYRQEWLTYNARSG